MADDEAGARGRPEGAGADAAAGVVRVSEWHRAMLVSMMVTVVVVAAAACTHVHATRWVSDARETVLYRRETLWLPFPDAVSGFTLRLSLGRDLVVPGAELNLPHPGLDAEVQVLWAPTTRSANDVTGTIRVVEVTE